MIGVLPDMSIQKYISGPAERNSRVGDQNDRTKFKDQFNGKNPAQFVLKVKKDGGNVDAITAATVSSRAFCDAVQRAYDTYEKEGGNK